MSTHIIVTAVADRRGHCQLKTFGRIGAGIALLVLALLAIDRAVSRPPDWSWRTRVSADACAVYRAFYSSLPSRQLASFRSATAPWHDRFPIHVGSSFKSGQAPYSARTFTRGGLDAAGKGAQFNIDTGEYFAAVESSNPQLLRECFEGADGPSFYDGPGELFRSRAKLYALLTFQNRDEAALWQLTPVGLSPHGQHALLYAENICHGFCGGGFFFLFEKSDHGWTLIGTSVVWVS